MHRYVQYGGKMSLLTVLLGVLGYIFKVRNKLTDWNDNALSICKNCPLFKNKIDIKTKGGYQWYMEICLLHPSVTVQYLGICKPWVSEINRLFSVKDAIHRCYLLHTQKRELLFHIQQLLSFVWYESSCFWVFQTEYHISLSADDLSHAIMKHKHF